MSRASSAWLPAVTGSSRIATCCRISSALQMLVIWAVGGGKAAVFPLSVLFQCRRNNTWGVTGADVLRERTPAASPGVCSGECWLCCWEAECFLTPLWETAMGSEHPSEETDTAIEPGAGRFLVTLSACCRVPSWDSLGKIPD